MPPMPQLRLSAFKTSVPNSLSMSYLAAEDSTVIYNAFIIELYIICDH